MPMPPPPSNDDARTEFLPRQADHPAVDNSAYEQVAVANRHRRSTISIALPSSILANAQSPELRVYLVGQVARAAAVYNIHEIIVFSETPDPDDTRPPPPPSSRRSSPSSDTVFFATLLKYLETPQYLRKHLFPMSPDLRLVGLLNPLALPSHPTKDETPRFREGLPYLRSSSSAPRPNNNNNPVSRYVDVGLDRLVEVDRPVPVGHRVTIDLASSGNNYARAPGKYLFGRVVSRDTPALVQRQYWGYRVRTADSLADVFANSSIAPRGYDLTIGTSERGAPISASGRPSRSFALPEFSNLLIVFGGLHGLERSVHGDAKLEEIGISHRPDGSGSNIGDLFDFYLNTCPQQGSRTIRTEEAILISLAALQPFLNAPEL